MINDICNAFCGVCKARWSCKEGKGVNVTLVWGMTPLRRVGMSLRCKNAESGII